MVLNFLDFLFGGISIDFIFNCIMSILLGAFISFSLIKSGQLWARSFSNITTYCILPLIGLVITTVISGNIALSLGMVGALSIIRFRHPVKSPLELSIYFLLLTIGITIPSSLGKAILLSLFSMIVIYGYAIYKKSKIKGNSTFFDLSFSGDEPSYLLEITSNKENSFLSNNQFLLFSYENRKNSLYTYKLSFNNKNEADTLREDLSQFKEISEIKYSRL